MSTRTAIFKEQANGTFQGIYCHHDGYLEGVGAALIKFYQDPVKIQRVIEKGKSLSSIGVSEEVRRYYDERDDLYNENGDLKYCLYVGEETEKYIAADLEQIRTFNYLTLSTNDEVDGYHQHIAGKDIFVPYRGSDNNGYLYVQKQSGQWLVSTQKKDGDMTQFKPLNSYFKNQAS
ncbi:hypothetical protein [Leuconostoc mesenteroides]|uniref:hypothetical protein n=1 Tax=Leuconostoc mesenteroides TaxID=1245 RepID=UPI000B9D7E43|nr:hypothetical protein [Leuconostoc mesenteroides]BAX72866.1 hypothetical protein LEMES_01423 [Leuconostoc mesenteroides]